MKLEKDDFTALAGTIIIHLLALLLLFWGVLKAVLPLDDGGIPVNFGELTAVAGIYQPASGSSATQQTPAQPQQRPTQPQPQPQQRQTPAQPRQTQPQPQPQQRQNQTRTPPSSGRVITQERETTVPVPESTNNTNMTAANETARKEKEEAERLKREEEARLKREEEARLKKEEEARKQQEAIANRASSAFGGASGSGGSANSGSSGNAQENSRGDASSGISNPGSPFGNSNSRSTEGSGGYGSFNLSGRTTGSGGLPRPEFLSQEEGRIVINITVDPNGNVIAAEIGRGTTIDNASMRNSALSAARRAKFNKIQGTNNQTGTITYNYRLT